MRKLHLFIIINCYDIALLLLLLRVPLFGASIRGACVIYRQQHNTFANAANDALSLLYIYQRARVHEICVYKRRYEKPPRWRRGIVLVFAPKIPHCFPFAQTSSYIHTKVVYTRAAIYKPPVIYATLLALFKISKLYTNIYLSQIILLLLRLNSRIYIYLPSWCNFLKVFDIPKKKKKGGALASPLSKSINFGVRFPRGANITQPGDRRARYINCEADRAVGAFVSLLGLREA